MDSYYEEKITEYFFDLGRNCQPRGWESGFRKWAKTISPEAVRPILQSDELKTLADSIAYYVGSMMRIHGDPAQSYSTLQDTSLAWVREHRESLLDALSN